MFSFSEEKSGAVKKFKMTHAQPRQKYNILFRSVNWLTQTGVSVKLSKISRASFNDLIIFSYNMKISLHSIQNTEKIFISVLKLSISIKKHF